MFPAWRLGEPRAHAATAPAERREVRIPIEDFVLTDQHGRSFAFGRMHGKVVLVTFVYTSCPDVCPLITAAARAVQTELAPAERGAVQLLTITTDPEIDSPQTLRAYAGRYGADLTNWAFLTGDAGGLSRVWKNFGVRVRRRGRGLVDHTPLSCLVDASGVMRVAYVGASPDPRALLRDIRGLLTGSPERAR